MVLDICHEVQNVKRGRGGYISRQSGTVIGSYSLRSGSVTDSDEALRNAVIESDMNGGFLV